MFLDHTVDGFDEQKSSQDGNDPNLVLASDTAGSPNAEEHVHEEGASDDDGPDDVKAEAESLQGHRFWTAGVEIWDLFF